MFDTEKFICEIKLRPAIWDVRSKSYSNKTEKTKAWEEICSSFIDNFEALEKDEKNKEAIALQKKWKNIRDCYRRECAKKKTEKSGSGATAEGSHHQPTVRMACKAQSPTGHNTTLVLTDVPPTSKVTFPPVLIENRAAATATRCPYVGFGVRLLGCSPVSLGVLLYPEVQLIVLATFPFQTTQDSGLSPVPPSLYHSVFVDVRFLS
ncbi:hypothetical protein O3P69_010672 [Scylla paramamosain]|uniref:MADF domain-containing protein n=1 Tax=Scylla paramamosain TaxID=85552 RepID=A0AAW0THL8_SCYPA